MTFPDEGITADLTHSVHPTQLYAAAYLALLGLFLLWLQKRIVFPGQMLVAYLATYPILRSINEEFRGDSERGYFMEDTFGQALSNAQFISLVVSIAIVFWLRLGRKAKSSRPLSESKNFPRTRAPRLSLGRFDGFDRFGVVQEFLDEGGQGLLAPLEITQCEGCMASKNAG